MVDQLNQDEVIVYCKFYPLDWWIVAEEHQAAYQFILRLAEEEASAQNGLSDSIESTQDDEDFSKHEDNLANAKREAVNRHHRIMKLSKLTKVFSVVGILSRQSLVVIASLFEGAIKELFQCIFCRHPSRMYDFLLLAPDNAVRGKVDLKEIVDAPDKKQLIYSLAKKASVQATTTSFDKIIINLEKVTREALDKDEFSELGKHIEKRHKIVHEDYDTNIEVEEVLSAFTSYFKVLRSLENIAIANNILVKSIDDYK